MKTSIIPLCQQGIFIWQTKWQCRMQIFWDQSFFIFFFLLICVSTPLFIRSWAATVFRSPILETWTHLAVLFFKSSLVWCLHDILKHSSSNFFPFYGKTYIWDSVWVGTSWKLCQDHNTLSGFQILSFKHFFSVSNF